MSEKLMPCDNLISRSELLKHSQKMLVQYGEYENEDEEFEDFVKSSFILDAPSVANRTGRWEGYVCSECGLSSDYGSEPYCPFCGAHMIGGEDDG